MAEGLHIEELALVEVEAVAGAEDALEQIEEKAKELASSVKLLNKNLISVSKGPIDHANKKTYFFLFLVKFNTYSSSNGMNVREIQSLITFEICYLKFL